MTETLIRDAVADDFDRILELNDGEVRQTSPLDFERLGALAAIACHHKLATADGHIVAFLLAMREGAPYENDNYRWFASRFTRFLYVDRIVVDARFTGRKIGSLLYADLFDVAQALGIEYVTCEYNLEPPNPASKAFHEIFGFEEIGSQWLDNPTKRVSLQAAQVG